MTREKIDRIFDDMLRRLRENEVMASKEDLIEKFNLKKSVEWLKSAQRVKGFWGYESVADTALVLLALASYGAKMNDRWRTVDGVEGGIGKAVNWLLGRFKMDSWGNNLWDTAMVLRAFKALDLDVHEAHRALNWISKRVEEMDDYIPNDIHHVAQGLIALHEWGQPATQLAEEFIKVLKEIDLDQIEPYKLGQIMEFITVYKLETHDEVTYAIEDRLTSYLMRVAEGGLSEGNFLNAMEALKGLARRIGGYEYIDKVGTGDKLRSALDKILKEMLSPYRRKRNGSWYNDPKKTARAILTILSLSDVRHIIQFPKTIHDILNDGKGKVIEVVDAMEKSLKSKINESFKIALKSLLGFILTAIIIASAFIIYSKTSLSKPLYQSIFELLLSAGAGTASAVFSIKELLKLRV